MILSYFLLFYNFINLCCFRIALILWRNTPVALKLEADKSLYPVLLSNGNLIEQGDLEVKI